MSTDPQMQTVAAQNALSGEKTFRTVQFAVTGNTDADAIAGIVTILTAAEITFRAKQRILEFLSLRYKDDADANDRMQQSLQGLDGTSLVQAQSIVPESSGLGGQLYPSMTGHTPIIWGNAGTQGTDVANQKPSSMLTRLAQAIGIK